MHKYAAVPAGRSFRKPPLQRERVVLKIVAVMAKIARRLVLAPTNQDSALLHTPNVFELDARPADDGGPAVEVLAIEKNELILIVACDEIWDGQTDQGEECSDDGLHASLHGERIV